MKSIDVKVDSPLHQRLVSAVRARKKISEVEVAKRLPDWEKADKECMAYIHEKEADALRRNERDNLGEPQYTTIQVPYSYALLMSAHTYWSSVFLSRSPVLQFAGRHGESEHNVTAVESLMDYQTQVGEHLPAHYIWLYDAGKYGVGITGEYWDDEVITYSKIEEVPVTLLGMPLAGKTQKKKVTVNVPGYSGNRLFNVRPADYLPDPRVPVRDTQKGEFVGRKVDIPITTLMRRKLSGQYINVDEARRRGAGSASEREPYAGDGTHELPDSSTDTAIGRDQSNTSSIPAVEMVIDIVPSEWGLGSTDYPEKWVFTVADDKILIEAHPLGLNHGKFPFTVLECEIEGYSIFKRSMLDIARPLNYVMEWLINTHFYHTRQTLNGQIIFDPSRIVAKDLLSNEPGKRIRIKPEAYGQDIRTMIHTMGPDAAVTQGHIGDTRSIMEMMQVALGVNDTVTGALNPGGRKTATEVRTSTSSSINRMKTIAEYFSATGFAPLAQRMLQSTQQNYSAEKKFRIAGDAIANPEKFMRVTPEDIAGAYDYTPVDGTMPIDRFAMVNMWANLMTQMKNYPQVGAEYNISEIFAWVAQLGGLKNIKQFKINAMAPGQLQAQVQQGNMIPMGGGNGGSGANPGGGIGGGDRNTPRVPGLTQVAGMGPAG
jgi:hypothetical protein